MGIAVADSWRGPYRKVKQPLFPEQGEDPYIWRSAAGYWHMLMHGCKDPYTHSKDSWCFTVGTMTEQGRYCGRFAYSSDLKNWRFSPPPAYNSTVTWRSGNRQAFLRRERPQIIFVRGQPAFLITGVQPISTKRTGSYTYTLIQPINIARQPG